MEDCQGPQPLESSDPPCMTGMYAEIFLELANLLNFTFLLQPPKDQQYGTLQDDGTWNGMIGEIHINNYAIKNK